MADSYGPTETIDRPDTECEVCSESSTEPIGNDDLGSIYNAATRTIIFHAQRGSYFECKALPACEECRVELGACIDLDAPPCDGHCSLESTASHPASGETWAVLRVQGVIWLAAGPIHRDNDDIGDRCSAAFGTAKRDGAWLHGVLKEEHLMQVLDAEDDGEQNPPPFFYG